MPYNQSVAWEIEFTDQFGHWYLTLADDEQDAITAAVDHLEADGPGVGRPLVDTISRSRHSNMKELRPPVGNIRILFAFDPRRMAIMLLGGDETNRWSAWYRESIPHADDLYDDHLQELRDEGVI